MILKNMGMKSRLVAAAFVAAMLSSCTGDPEADRVMIFWTLGVIALVGFCVVYMNFQGKKEKEMMEAREREERRREEEEERRRERERVAAYEAARAALARSEGGEADKTIVLAELDPDREIRAYSVSRAVFILGRRYAFGDILGCSVTDDYSVRKGAAAIELSGETDAKTGSVVGRAIVGGALAGDGGALLGGATASTKTSLSGTASFGDDTIIHDYTVRVTVRDISRPTVGIHVGPDAAKASEIASLFEVIVDGNRRG